MFQHFYRTVAVKMSVSKKSNQTYLIKLLKQTKDSFFLNLPKVNPRSPLLNKWSYVLYQWESGNFHSYGKIKPVRAVHFYGRKKKKKKFLSLAGCLIDFGVQILYWKLKLNILWKKNNESRPNFFTCALSRQNWRSEFLKSWNCMNCLLFTVGSLCCVVRCLV